MHLKTIKFRLYVLTEVINYLQNKFCKKCGLHDYCWGTHLALPVVSPEFIIKNCRKKEIKTLVHYMKKLQDMCIEKFGIENCVLYSCSEVEEFEKLIRGKTFKIGKIEVTF